MLNVFKNNQGDKTAAQASTSSAIDNNDISRLKRLQREVFDELVGIKRRLTDVEQQQQGKRRGARHQSPLFASTTRNDGTSTETTLLLQGLLTKVANGVACSMRLLLDHPINPHQRLAASLATRVAGTHACNDQSSMGVVSLEQFQYHHHIHDAATISVAAWQPVVGSACNTAPCTALADATACPHMRGVWPSGMSLSVHGATGDEAWRLSSTTSWSTMSDDITVAAVLHSHRPWQLRVQSNTDELGQQWGVAGSAREWQAAARCRVGSEAWWVTPTLSVRKHMQSVSSPWQAHFSIIMDVEL